MEIQIRKLDNWDLELFTGLIRVFEEVFAMNDFRIPPTNHLRELLKRTDFLVFVALHHTQVVGGLTLYTLTQYYSIRPLAYLYDLAVLEPYQRKGIGRKLIDSVCSFCRENDYEEIFVQADKIDTHAIEFYRRTKPTNEEDVLHFYYTL